MSNNNNSSNYNCNSKSVCSVTDLIEQII